ncbi:hypothetical protein GQ607_017542 [Colletotrichum asianum]|uniref:Uncharacterized protein n=1 Tax=Colletotrichum asianum TaxID=702518 RepID=A0A8H3VRN4_9PEZI|nr:hypothetical protein GQ607_017542 [Colletotrichum asianum]
MFGGHELPVDKYEVYDDLQPQMSSRGMTPLLDLACICDGLLPSATDGMHQNKSGQSLPWTVAVSATRPDEGIWEGKTQALN